MASLAPFIAQIEIPGVNLLVLGILSLLAGILVFVVPRVLNYIVATYLVIVGIIWIVAGL